MGPAIHVLKFPLSARLFYIHVKLMNIITNNQPIYDAGRFFCH